MQTKTTAQPRDTMYEVPHENKRWPSLGLAAAMHAGLFFFLWVGIHWESHEPMAVEAEVWDMKVQSAAPPPPPPPEAVEPPPPPPPTPAPEVAPPPPPPEKVETPPAAPSPDIALEQLKKKQKLEKEKLAEAQRQQKLEQQKQEKAEQAERDAALAKAEAKEKAKVDAKKQAAADAKAKAAADAKAAAEAEKEQELADKKAADKLKAEKAQKDKARAAAEQKAADKQRASEMARMTAQVGSGTTGTAAQSTGPRSDNGYVAAITAKIKSNIAYGGSTDASGSPRAEYKIEQLPTGEIISVRKIKSSGIPAYDSAVETAIAKSSPLPKRKDGTVAREVVAGFNLKD